MPNWSYSVILVDKKDFGMLRRLCCGGDFNLNLIKPIPLCLLPDETKIRYRGKQSSMSDLVGEINKYGNKPKEKVIGKFLQDMKKYKTPDDWSPDNWERFFDTVRNGKYNKFGIDRYYMRCEEWGTKWLPRDTTIWEKECAISFATPWGEPTVQIELTKYIKDYAWYCTYEGDTSITFYDCTDGDVDVFKETDINYMFKETLSRYRKCKRIMRKIC